MIDLAPAHLALVRLIVHAVVPKAKVWVYGSRIKDQSRPYSDLDLTIVTPKRLSHEKLTELQDAFAESDLPILVDLSRFDDLPAFLQQEIQSRHLSL